MPIYPGARVRLIDKKFLSGNGNGLPILSHNRSNVHTQAGLGSLYGFYSQPGRASSHGWVAKTGLVEQYVDTSLRAEADLQGNDATHSWEVEGGVEPYTPEQVEALVALLTWDLSTHGIPYQVAHDSKIGPSSWGLSIHRCGIDGNFPPEPSVHAGRLQHGGGMHYSTSTGKVCPGDARIDQLYNIIFPRVLANLSGTVPPVIVVDNPVTPPKPAPSGIDEDGWFGSDTIREIQRQAGTPVDGELWYQYKGNAQPAFTTGWVYNYTKGKGSPAWAWVQGRLGTPQDGVFGQTDLRALEARAGYPYDSRLDGPSNTIKWLQHALNTHTL